MNDLVRNFIVPACKIQVRRPLPRYVKIGSFVDWEVPKKKTAGSSAVDSSVVDVLGYLGSMGNGLQVPLMMYVLSDVINEYANPSGTISNASVDKYALRLLYVAIGVRLSAFVEGLCWARTAERQPSRMRLTYLKSVLKQDVGFFDTQVVDSSTTYQVVSTISSDSSTIQVTIGEKWLLSADTELSCLLVIILLLPHICFTLSWRLTLAALPFTLMYVLPGIGFGKLMMDVGTKMVDSYGVVGGIAEQAISSIRTVYSYVGERQTINRFSNALERSMTLGIKQGSARGLMIGSMGIVYVSWGFQAWFGFILVTEKGEKGGNIFIAGFNYLMGGT
ncbi:hypothetical protein RJ639_042352 [Escallonia herrerae]|uniref:ABC transmembrane type-1 domain-containing protein n=1 Tax=Escallonia herrerae TaxID=1293975 RepID=A0AA89B6X1_9ASTE|nr:hypothetical protein RJ639_042352 [Escallonia herrerae]